MWSHRLLTDAHPSTAACFLYICLHQVLSHQLNQMAWTLYQCQATIAKGAGLSGPSIFTLLEVFQSVSRLWCGVM